MERESESGRTEKNGTRIATNGFSNDVKDFILIHLENGIH